MKKGEIWIIDIPGLGGHSQQGTRPALIIAAPKLPVVIAIPCTSNLQALKFPYTIRIEPSNRNGLTVPSIALVFQMLAIDRKFIQKKIGTLEKQLLTGIDTQIQKLLLSEKNLS